MKKAVIKGLSSHFGSRHEYLKVSHYLVLAGKITKVLRADNSIQFIIFALIDVMGIEICRHRQIKIIIYKDIYIFINR
jgi:hypothetical protein